MLPFMLMMILIRRLCVIFLKKNNPYKVFLKCSLKEAETKCKVYKNKLISILWFSEKQYYGNKLVEYKILFKTYLAIIK
jgi:hypothetical protein